MEKERLLELMKKKEKIEKERLLELMKKKNKIGNSSAINLNEILFDIAKLKNDISTEDIKTEPLTTSYETLKTTIDEINTKIDEFKKTLIDNSYSNSAEPSNIINKLQEINEFMRVGNYQSIYNTNIHFVKEAIATDSLRKVVKDATSAFHEKLTIIKKDIQENSQQKYNIEIKIKMEQLILEYEANIKKFEEFKKEIDKYINELEILYKFELPDSIDMINKQFIKEDHLIIVNENENVISRDINELYEEIIQSDGSVSDTDMIMPMLTLSSPPLSVKSKYYKKFINNFDYKKNIINLHKHWLEILKNYKNKLEDKLENKILIGGSPTSLPYIDSTTPFHFDDLIKLFIKYKEVVHKFKILSNDIIKLVKKYNVRYVQFIHFQNWILKYMEINITNGEYKYYKYMSHNEIQIYHTTLNNLKMRIDNFNNTNLSLVQIEFTNIQIYKWFYKNHYFIINILENFFDKLLKYLEKKDKQNNKLFKTANKDEIISNYFFLFNIFLSTLEQFRLSDLNST